MLDMILNEVFCKKVIIALILDKVKVRKPRLFDHIHRRQLLVFGRGIKRRRVEINIVKVGRKVDHEERDMSC